MSIRSSISFFLLALLQIVLGSASAQTKSNTKIDSIKSNNQNFIESVNNYERLISLNELDFDSYYQRGLCFIKLNKPEKACIDLDFARQFGVDSSKMAYKNHCDSLSTEEDLDFTGAFQSKGHYLQGEDKVRYDSKPTFPGGMDSLRIYLVKQLMFDTTIQLEISSLIITAILNINKEGVISNVYFLNDNQPHKSEIINSIKSGPKWTPAFKQGKAADCTYHVSIYDTKNTLRTANRLYNRGVHQMQNDSTKDAIQNFELAIIMNPKDHEAYYNRGICHLKNGDTLSACNDWSFAVFAGYENAYKLIRRVCDGVATYKSDTLDLFSEIFTVVETMPEFPGGQQMLFQFLQKNLKYPKRARENGTQGRVYVTFTINSIGDVANAKILRGIGSGCDEAALDVVNLMPRWTPGYQDGRRVNVQYNLPINFKLGYR